MDDRTTERSSPHKYELQKIENIVKEYEILKENSEKRLEKK